MRFMFCFNLAVHSSHQLTTVQPNRDHSTYMIVNKSGDCIIKSGDCNIKVMIVI